METMGIIETENVNADGDLDPGDLDVLIKRFLNLKDPKCPSGVSDLEDSFQDDDLFKHTPQNTSACDYQWFNDELGFGTFGESETGSPLCVGINTDYDVANIDMNAQGTMGMFKLSGSNQDDLEQQHGPQGEGIASITGSILQQFEAYEDSISGQESADLNNSMEMSICKSENLFSPLADNQPELPILSNFSTDSLDVRSDILATCTATNHHNYTIAFNGNNILEESYNTTSSAYRTANGTVTPSTDKLNTENDNRCMTDWKEMNPDGNKGISNNNGSSNDSSQWTVDNTSHLFTQSCPNAKILMANRRRIFDLGIRRRNYYQHNQNQSNNSITESNSNMVIGSPGSGGTSSGGSSVPMSSDESVNIALIPKTISSPPKTRMEKVKPTTTAQVAEIIKKSIQIQTSYSKVPSSHHIKQDGSKSVPVYICYPNYTLPDLKFLSESSSEGNTSDVYLIPQHYKVPFREKRIKSAGYHRTKRPMSCNDIDELRASDLSHIRDWPSLHFLLPEEYRTILKDMNMKYEENNEDEKSSEAGLGLDENYSPVVMRKKLGQGNNTNLGKRYSLNSGSAHGKASSRRFAKRFSLQEPIIPEINEITNEINKNLRVLNEIESEIFDIPDIYSSSEAGVPVPQNTPKISFIDNNEGVTPSLLPTMRTIQNSVTRMSRMNIPNLTEKQSLAEAIAQGVSQIQSVCKPPQGRTPSASASSNLIIFSKSPAGKLVLESLCPALYSLLSDGLCPFLDTIFGKIPNTVWRVIEASIQYGMEGHLKNNNFIRHVSVFHAGPSAQTLNELVMKINSEESLAEGPMKFNAFICGLLNLGNLSSWLLFLRTKERLLRTHYDSDGLMFLCNTSTRSLYDQMVEVVNYLTKLPFQLDIFYEIKLLHESIVSNKSKPISHGSHGGLRSSSASASRKHSHIDSNKLSNEQHGKGYTSSKNSKYYVNQLKKTQMKRSFSDERPNSSKVHIGSSIPKSKTSQNIHTEKHYGSAPKLSKHSKTSKTSVDFESHHRILRVKDQEKGIEPTKAQQRPKSLGNPTQLLLMDEFTKEHGPGGKDSEKFRNLRMQWELLTSDEVRGKPTGLVSPGSGVNTVVGSKIPRPITSPIKTANNPSSPHFRGGKR